MFYEAGWNDMAGMISARTARELVALGEAGRQDPVRHRAEDVEAEALRLLAGFAD